MMNPTELAQDYLAIWNEYDDAARRSRLAETWSTDARYIDPMMKGEGRDGIAAMIAEARAGFLGHTFTLRGTPDGNGAFVRFSWTLAADGSEPAAQGTDVVRVDADGRIAEVIGFLDGNVA